jgi:Ca-activated chloride channel family protein
MASMHEAATGFLRTLREGDRGAVVAFSDSVKILQSLTDNRALLDDAVKSTVAGGGTALNNALYISLREFGGAARQAGGVRRRAIAVLSDGEDTTSLVSFDDVLELARKSGVSIYTIGLHTKEPAEASPSRRFITQSQYSLKELAQETGAEAFFPLDILELQGVYGSIAQELSSQYSIGYSPSNSRADGRFRTIAVQIVSRPDLRPKTRRGYTAEGGLLSSDQRYRD